MQFMGHFPQEHVMPGVLMVEAMAQAGAVIILSLPENEGKIAYFAGIDKCKFKRKVIPGDTLVIEVGIVSRKGPIGIGEGTIKVDGQLAVTAQLKFAIGD
jgi:3-hydroxyacyl-[acyl-carrier-protein] dehydratase